MPLSVYHFLKPLVLIQDLKTKEAVQLLTNNYIGHLAFLVGKRPFCVPITFFYDKDNNTIISYAIQGHKIKAMRQNPEVCLAISDIDSVSSWRSVMVHGTFEELKSIDAKYYLHEFSEGVKGVIRRKEKDHLKFINEFSAKLESVGIPVIYRIVLDDMTAKFRKE